MRVLSLFSGIGGLDLAATWAGMQVVGQVEIDTYCQAVLAKHWPSVKRVSDVREVWGDTFGAIDLVMGGFPCQPFSVAGKQRGAADDRHLWPEMRRIIQVYQPTWIVGENVPGLIRLGLDDVLADMDADGYEATAVVLPAAATGAPHLRERVFVVARRQDRAGVGQADTRRLSGLQLHGGPQSRRYGPAGRATRGRAEDVADSDGQRRQQESPSASRHEAQASWRQGQGERGRLRNHEPSGDGQGDELAHARCEGQPTRRTGSGYATVGEAPHDGITNGSGLANATDRGIRRRRTEGRKGQSALAGEGVGLADAAESGLAWRAGRRATPEPQTGAGVGFQSERGGDVVNASGAGRQERDAPAQLGWAGQPDRRRDGRQVNGRTQSRLGRTAHGLPHWLDFPGWPAGPGQVQYAWEAPRTVTGRIANRANRLKALGNAVVPQQAHPLFAAIMAVEMGLADIEAEAEADEEEG